jgi:hypothetical protein
MDNTANQHLTALTNAVEIAMSIGLAEGPVGSTAQRNAVYLNALEFARKAIAATIPTTPAQHPLAPKGE